MKKIIDKIFNSSAQAAHPRSDEKNYRKRQVGTSDDDDCYLIDEKGPAPTAIIYQSELDYLSRCILDYPNIETGGQLFGFWTNQGVPVVLYVIGPGRHANHQPTFFNQDSDYLMTVGNELLNRYGLCHIGEWHSHHQLGLARPSGHDARTMHNGLIRIPQRRLLLCIGNYRNGRSTINPYNFHENDLHGYADALWQIIEIDSPFRKIADRELNDILIHPITQSPRQGDNRLLQISSVEHKSKPEKKIRIPASYWIAQEGNLTVLKSMLQLTRNITAITDIDTQADESGIVQFHICQKNIDIRFSKDFPSVCPEIYVKGKKIQPDAIWNTPTDNSGIYSSYETWLSQLFINKQ